MKFSGACLDALLQLFAGQPLFADGERAIRAVHRDARSVHQREQRSGFTRDLHLLVIVGVAQLAITLQHGLVEFGGAAQGVHKQRRRDAMQLGVSRVEQDEPVLGKDAGVKFGEGVGERLAFHIALAQVIGRERVAQQFRRLGDQFVGSLRETNVGHGRAGSSGGVGLEGHKLKVVRSGTAPG